MSSFQQTDLGYAGAELQLDGAGLAELAERFGTPLYVYSAPAVRRALDSFRAGLGDREHLICYAVKASSNIHLIELLRREGCGADIVSGGELVRAQRAGVPGDRIVFSGVGKTDAEIRAGLAAGILFFVVESEAELERLSQLAQETGSTARISLRVNPDIDAETHPYISTGMREHKFGIDHARVLSLYKRAQELPGVHPVAIGCHIGSQLTGLQPFRDAALRVNDLIREVRALGVNLRYVDVGGGLGIPYRKTPVDGQAADRPPAPAEYTRTLAEAMPADLKIVFEPGRSIIGEAGLLLTRVILRKHNGDKLFIICDAGMNDLLRPALYSAYHEIMPLHKNGRAPVRADLVGPVCESGDFFARDREMADFQPGDLALLASAGAYAFCMASNYNSRGRPAEVLVEAGGQARLIRRRETDADMLRLEEDL